VCCYSQSFKPTEYCSQGFARNKMSKMIIFLRDAAFLDS
jgi:hypothetical protein